VTVEAPKAEAGEPGLALAAGVSASREASPPSDESVATALSPPRLEREAVGTIAAFSGGAAVSEGRVRQERFNRLQGLLFSEEAPPSAEIGDLASAILADPYMANLKYAAEVEAWMADIICAASPRSDPVIERAVPHFRWDADFGKLDQPPKVTAIVERWRGLLFLHHISQPGHEYHTAWRELARRDEGPAWNKWFIGGKVRHLLAVIRDRYPAAETGLNPYRVGMWEPDVGPQDYEWFGMWGALMFFLFPPGAMAVAWFNHNPTWFRIAVSLWAAFWIVATLTRG
jgi:hypothetical protein